MKHIEKIVAEFDEKCFNDDGWNMRMYDETKSFLRQSHTSFIQNLIQRVEGENRFRCGACDGAKVEHTQACQFKDTIIKMLKEEIE
jgi:hypothetical protein